MNIESSHADQYAENIINTIREPFVVLNEALQVVSANHSFYKAFHVLPEDTVGQLLYDLGNKQWDIPTLRMLLEEILPQDHAFDNFEVRHNFPAIGEKIMLLNGPPHSGKWELWQFDSSCH